MYGYPSNTITLSQDQTDDLADALGAILESVETGDDVEFDHGQLEALYMLNNTLQGLASDGEEIIGVISVDDEADATEDPDPRATDTEALVTGEPAE